MKLIALMPARNESWIIGLSLRAALRWCDEVVVLDHCSTDDTFEIALEIKHENPSRVTILTDCEPVWSEMAHRQRLLETAREFGATHCAIVDADEVLTGNLLESVRPAIERLPAGMYLRSRMYCMWRAADRYRHDRSIWSNRDDLALAFPLSPGLGWRTDNGYDHHHREPYGVRPGGVLLQEPGGVMHLQFASWRRLKAKHALYKMVEKLRWPSKTVHEIDRMYSLALNEDHLVTRGAPAEWWAPYADLLPHLRLEHDPWQEAECRRLMVEHGDATFRGLNLWGVADAD